MLPSRRHPNSLPPVVCKYLVMERRHGAQYADSRSTALIVDRNLTSSAPTLCDTKSDQIFGVTISNRLKSLRLDPPLGNVVTLMSLWRMRYDTEPLGRCDGKHDSRAFLRPSQ